jgi:hypothetical protein
MVSCCCCLSGSAGFFLVLLGLLDLGDELLNRHDQSGGLTDAPTSTSRKADADIIAVPLFQFP